jgi:succinyl-diaminopimelate desuccinylase
MNVNEQVYYNIKPTIHPLYYDACYNRNMLEYLETLVAFHPVSGDQKSVLRLLEYVSQHLTDRGLKTHIYTYNGVVNLYASPTGEKHSKVLLQSHIDVVPGGEPFRLDGDRCYGRGVYDMLFAAAAYMKLADELFEQDLACDIAFMLTGDEELGGHHGVQAMLSDGFTTDVCILPDAGDNWGSLSISAKGIYQPTISVQGTAHHGSRPWEGDGAAIKLAHLLIEAEKLFDTSDQFNSTMTVSRLDAGIAHNQGPAEATATLDIRYKDQADLRRITDGLNKILAKYDGTIISLMDGHDYQLDPDVPLIKDFVALYERHLGQSIRMTRAHGSSDARYFQQHNMSVIMLRPDGGSAHGDNEWLSVPQFYKFYDLLREYITTVAVH